MHNEGPTPDEGPTVFPLTAAQERLWIVERITPGTAAYHIPLGLRLRGSLREPELRTALQLVVDRHEVLRTGIEVIDGQAVQVVHPSAAVPLTKSTLPAGADADGSLRRAIDAETARPFDLAAPPLLRAWLGRLGEEDHVLVVTMHHLVADMWSCGIVLDELAACYRQATGGPAASLAELPVQYPDYAVWEREMLAGPRTDELLVYWRDRMAGAPPALDLPVDRPRPPVQSLRGHQLPVSLSAELSSRVREVARTRGVTPFMVLLAGFQILLGRYTDQDDIVVSTGTGTRPPDAERLIGCFINTIPLRTSLGGGPSFADVLARVRETTLGALDHQDLPFDRLVTDLRPQRDLSRTPFAQVMFILQNAPVQAPALPELAVSVEPAERGGAQCDLDIQLRDEEGRYTGFAEYAKDLFDVETIRRMWSHFEVLLDAATADPERPAADLPWLSPDEIKRQVLDWNRTGAPAAPRCLHHLFEERAMAAPAAIALAWPGGQLDYRTLNAQADAVAARLSELGVGPDDLVAVCLDRSPEFTAAVLGTLKAGGAYVPMDPGYPVPRLSAMLSDARPVVLLTSGELLGRLPVDAATGALRDVPGFRVTVLDVASELATRAADQPSPRVPARVTPGNLAYVIYTSGSTGVPKGVTVTHRGVVNNIIDLNRRENVGPGDRVLSLSATSFDMSVYELFGLLAAGGTVVLPGVDGAKDPRHWANLIEDFQVTIWNSAPSLLESLVVGFGDRKPDRPSLRAAFLGGDWIPVTLPDRARALFPGLKVHALGGATEVSIHSIDFPVAAVDPEWQHIPYGRPMDGQQALIVDRRLRPVPPGVPGELCLAGTGLSRGYLGRPGATAERFVPHPYAGAFPGIEPGARIYRTGDLCRYAPNGTIHLIGRLDHQVKVRGFRIELGEIDAVLRRHTAVADVVTVARRDEEGRGTGTVSYFVTWPDAPVPDTSALRAHARESLPDHMVPDLFVPLDELPLSSNGKIDRKSLPDPGPRRPTLATAYVAPSTPVELAIADIWMSVLRLDQVGAEDDFFELGGNSLGVTQVAAAMLENLRVDIPLREAFEATTVAGQARVAMALAAAAGFDATAIAGLYLEVRAMTSEQASAMLMRAEGTR